MYYVYCITNIINQKKYVGITTGTIEKRWKQHLNTAFNLNSEDSKAIFKKAIRKYGKNSWRIEQIDTADNVKTLKEKEIFWIKKLNTYAFDKDGWGYNSTRGGDLVSEQFRVPVCICDIISGKVLYSCASKKEAELITKARIEKIEQPNMSSGGYCILYQSSIINLTEEQIKNKIHSLYPNLVYQLDLKGNIIQLYRNTAEASKTIKCSQGNLTMACEGKRRLCYGYQWAYQCNLQEKINKPVKDINITKISVVQYSLSGEKIKVWDSIKQVADQCGYADSHISQCCKGTRKSSNGFQWRYAEDKIERLDPIFTKRKVQCIETQEVFETPYHAAKHFGYAQQTVKKSCITGGNIQKPFHFAWYDD